MTELFRILRMILMLLPFVVLCWMNYKANIKKPQRYKQFLMPVAALILCTIAIILLTKIYDLTIQMFLNADDWVDKLGQWLAGKMPMLGGLAGLLTRLAAKIKQLVDSLNLEFWAFYVANALILLAYVILKKPILLFMKGLFRDGSLFLDDMTLDEAIQRLKKPVVPVGRRGEDLLDTILELTGVNELGMRNEE